MLYSGLIAFLDRDQWQSEPCGLRHSLSGRDDRGSTGSHSDAQYSMVLVIGACRRDHCTVREDDRGHGKS